MATTTQISIAFTATGSVTVTAPAQSITILDATNRNYLRSLFLTNQGVKMVSNGNVVYIPTSSLFAAAAAAVPAMTWPPIILSQPTASVITAPATASFAIVTSSELPVTYHWQSGSSSSGSFNNTGDSGSSSPQTYITCSNQVLSGNYYRCIVSNASGAITSSTVPLTVN